MKNYLLLLGALLLSGQTFAHTTFVGNVKNSTEKCFLEVEQSYYENNTTNAADFRAEVVVGLDGHGHDDHGHDDHGHGETFTFVIKPTDKSPLILSGIADNNKDQVNVLVAPNSQELNAPVSYSVKWWHISHFHSFQCLNLKAIDHE
jgi:hypothetical protein